MSKTVLIVENYADRRSMMKIIVQWYGYDVIEATNGYEAIEKTVQYHPDLILMDLVLPQIDAATATRIIRKIEGYDKVSIVAMTESNNACYEKVIASGFDDVLVQPLYSENMKPYLRRYIH